MKESQTGITAPLQGNFRRMKLKDYVFGNSSVTKTRCLGIFCRQKPPFWPVLTVRITNKQTKGFLTISKTVKNMSKSAFVTEAFIYEEALVTSVTSALPNPDQWRGLRSQKPSFSPTSLQTTTGEHWLARMMAGILFALGSSLPVNEERWDQPLRPSGFVCAGLALHGQMLSTWKQHLWLGEKSAWCWLCPGLV